MKWKMESGLGRHAQGHLGESSCLGGQHGLHTKAVLGCLNVGESDLQLRIFLWRDDTHVLDIVDICKTKRLPHLAGQKLLHYAYLAHARRDGLSREMSLEDNVLGI